MMTSHQDLLADLGLLDYEVVPLAETDHRVDTLMLSSPDGRVLDIPEPFEEIGLPPLMLIDRVRDSFPALSTWGAQRETVSTAGAAA